LEPLREIQDAPLRPPLLRARPAQQPGAEPPDPGHEPGQSLGIAEPGHLPAPLRDAPAAFGDLQPQAEPADPGRPDARDPDRPERSDAEDPPPGTGPELPPEAPAAEPPEWSLCLPGHPSKPAGPAPQDAEASSPAPLGRMGLRHARRGPARRPIQ